MTDTLNEKDLKCMTGVQPVKLPGQSVNTGNIQMLQSVSCMDFELNYLKPIFSVHEAIYLRLKKMFGTLK